MNKRAQRLLPVIDMAQTAEQEAAGKLRQYKAALQIIFKPLQSLKAAAPISSTLSGNRIVSKF